jgi:predicted acetyltransferase
VTTTTTGVVIGPVDLDSAQLLAWMTSASRGLKDPHAVPVERVDLRRPVYRTQRVTAATDRDQVVGTFRSWDLDLTVPGGGSLRADAISSVTVQPTHRRRGILTSMMAADLAAAAERGVPVAILIASEGGIYGRFGFGVGVETATWTVDLRTARLRPEATASLDGCRILPAADLREEAPQVYARSRAAGAIDRADDWWDLRLGIVPWPGDERKHQVAVLHRADDGTPDGYLLYRVEEVWVDGVARSTVHVVDLMAASTNAYRALWRYLVELDLVAAVRAEERPRDEALPWLLTDPRAARQTSRCDFEWTRLLDPAAALSGRRYETLGACSIEVIDPDGWASGRFLLEVAPDGTGSCAPTSRPAEVGLTVQALSALWLGGGSIVGAVLGGQAVEHVDGAAGRLGGLLRTTRAPWTSTSF